MMRKHILLYTDDPGQGGVAHHNHTLLLGLVERGHRVTAVQSNHVSPLIERQKQLGIHHEWLDFDTIQAFNRTFTNPTDAQTIFAKVRPDLILFSDCCPISNFAAKQVAAELGIPYVIVIGFVAPYLAERFSPSFDPAFYLEVLACRYEEARAVIAVSQENLGLLHELFNLPARKGQVIVHGRPEEYFAPRSSLVRDRLRQSLNIPPDAVVCFTAARLEAVKGYQYQLDAIVQLQQTPVWSKLYFVWAGEGFLKAQLAAAAQQRGATNQIKLLGHRWDVADWYDAADIFILPSELEGMPLVVIEAMAKGLPVLASAVSGIPEALGDTGQLLTNPKLDAQATIHELVDTIQAWAKDLDLRQAIGQAGRRRAEVMFREGRAVQQMMDVVERALLPAKDYVSPALAIIQPDAAFSHLIVGDPTISQWAYFRREIPHNWYVDERQQTVGFLSRDEAHILYNTALKFKGHRALEIGCWLGWSACHLALAGVKLDVIDPLLSRTEFYQSVSSSLQTAGVLSSVNLVPGFSPQKVEELAAQEQRQWSLIFIDGDHDAPGPLRDAIACEQLAEPDAMILFHDLASPDVTQGLDYLKQKGWNTLVYQTMQIMGVAWRGNVEPIAHQPDPNVNWQLPSHLSHYPVSGISTQPSIQSNIKSPLDTQQSPVKMETQQATQRDEATLQQVQMMMQQAVDLLNSDKPVEAMRLADKAAAMGLNVPGMHYLRSICLCKVGRHKEGLQAAQAELAFNPTHPQAQEQVEGLTRGLSQASKPQIPTEKRTWNTGLPRETLLSVQQASHNYSYRGVSMIKNPFDAALYPLLLWNLKPRTIIEIGSKEGGSALWLGDMLSNFGIEGHIYSIDIVRVATVEHPRVTFLEGNGRALQETLTPDFLNALPRPLLVIEDADHAYETSQHVLDFFHPHLKAEEFIVIEDGIISDLEQDAAYRSGPHQALKEFLVEHQGEYDIDSTYCDFFGYNLTWNTNGYLRKLVNTPTKQPGATEPDTVLAQLLSSIEQLTVPSGLPSASNLNRPQLGEWLQQGKADYARGEFAIATAAFTEVVEVYPGSAIAHLYLSALHWQQQNLPQSLQHYALAHSAPLLPISAQDQEFQEILAMLRPYTLLSQERLFSLYTLAKEICLDDIPGNFVECGTYKGGSAALLAAVIQRYSLRPRKLYACDKFDGMPEPADVDRHDGVDAVTVGFGAGTLPAPVAENLAVICQALGVEDIVVPVQGLFTDTLPERKAEMGAIAFLHADGDWYESTLDIFNTLFDSVVAQGVIQIDDYGYWEGCKQAIHEFERMRGESFALRTIDSIGVWFRKRDAVLPDCDHWRSLWYVAQSAQRVGDVELAERMVRAVLRLVPQLVQADQLLNQLVPIHSPRFLEQLSSTVEQSHYGGLRQTALADLRRIRQQMAQFWLNSTSDSLADLYLGSWGKVHQVLLNSGLKDEPLLESERDFIQAAVANLSQGFTVTQSVQQMLATMLYCSPHQVPVAFDLAAIPQWLLGDYLKFMLSAPRVFQAIGEVDRYCDYLERWTNYLHEKILGHPEAVWTQAALTFTSHACFVPLYFSTRNLKDVYAKRGDILEFALKQVGHKVDFVFPERSPDRKKIRVGVLSAHFNPQTEIFSTLPAFEYLDREQFEIVLYALQSNQHPLEQYCRSRADQFVHLSEDLFEQVQTVRRDDLDVLLLANNVSAVANSTCLMAIHRLARVQLTCFSSPVTTGLRQVDYYLSGALSELKQGSEAAYRETLVRLENTGFCFNYAIASDPPHISPTRKSLGIPEGASAVYMSGASFHKIIPELRETWGKIMAAVPNSVLVLLPFSPSWGGSSAAQTFIDSMKQSFVRGGIPENRLVILDALPSRADIKECLKLGDVYLDSYPHSGANSLVDPLEVGMPAVVIEGDSLRSRQAAAMLREIHLTDLITESEAAYVDLAIALGIDSTLRQQMSQQIQQKMQNPGFLDSRRYSAQIGSVFQDLFRTFQFDSLQERFRLRDVNLIVFPDWSQPEETLFADLVDLLRVMVLHPDRPQTTLLIDTAGTEDEDADLAISGVLMHLLTEEEIEVTETGPEISLIGQLSATEWQKLQPYVSARLALEHENEAAIASSGMVRLDSYNLEEFARLAQN